jgi:hypothetical protein
VTAAPPRSSGTSTAITSPTTVRTRPGTRPTGARSGGRAPRTFARVSRQEAYPGDEGSNYTRNPGEAWARRTASWTSPAGITTETWPIVSQSFFLGLGAPGGRSRTDPAGLRAFHRRSTRLRQASERLVDAPATPLDGTVRRAPPCPSSAFDVALVGANRRTRSAPGRSSRVSCRSGPRLRSRGQRTLFVRVTSKGAPGRVRIAATTP